MAAKRPVDTLAAQIDLRQGVRDDHTQILALFHLYLGSPPDSRREMVETILHQLTLHLELEERLFPEARRWGPQGRQFVEDTEREQEKIKIMILELQQFEGDDDQAMDECFEDMMQSVRALFITEELNLLPFVNRTSDA